MQAPAQLLQGLRSVGAGAWSPLANRVDLDQGWAVIWPEGPHWVGLVAGNPETVTNGNRKQARAGQAAGSGSDSSGSGSAGSSASIETFGKTPEV